MAKIGFDPLLTSSVILSLSGLPSTDRPWTIPLLPPVLDEGCLYVIVVATVGMNGVTLFIIFFQSAYAKSAITNAKSTTASPSPFNILAVLTGLFLYFLVLSHNALLWTFVRLFLSGIQRSRKCPSIRIIGRATKTALAGNRHLPALPFCRFGSHLA